MNRLVMFSRPVASRVLLALLAPAALAACDAAAPEAPEEPPLAGATIGGPFTLTGEDGTDVSWTDFAGKYRIVYFGYAYCPDICPTDVQRAMAGLKQFEEANPAPGAEVQPLFVTIDPERDTPEVVGEFTENFHPRLIGLTGSPEQIADVADTFAVAYSRGEEGQNGGYLMNHSAITYLFGPDGEPLATLPTDQGPEAVAAELARWVT